MATIEQIIALKIRLQEENPQLFKKLGGEFRKLEDAIISQAREANKAAEARQKGEEKAAIAAGKAADRQEAAAQRVADKIQREVEKAGEAQKKAADKAAGATEKAASRQEAAVKRTADQAQKEAEKTSAAQQKAFDKEGEAAKKSADKEIEATKRAAAEREKALKAAEAAVEKLRKLDQQRQEQQKKESGILGGLEGKLARLRKAREEASDPKTLSRLNKEIKSTESQIDRTEKATSAFGVKGAAAFNKIASVAGGTAQVVGSIVTIVATLTAALFELSRASAEQAKSQEQITKATGLQAETGVALRAAIQDLTAGGTDFTSATRDVTDAVTQFQQQIVQARLSAGETRDTFATLGITLEDLNKLSIDQLLEKVADGMKGVADETDRATVNQKLFGEEGGRQFSLVLPKLQEYKQRVKETGELLSGDALKASKAFNDAFNQLGGVLEGLKTQLGADVIPLFVDLIKGVQAAIAEAKNNEDIRVGLELLFTTLKEIVFFANSTLVATLKEDLKLLGDVGVVLHSLQSPLESLKLLISRPRGETLFDALRNAAKKYNEESKGTVESNAEVAKSTEDAAEAQKKFKVSLNDAKGALNEIEKANDNLLKSEKARVEQEIAIIDDQAKRGIITEEAAIAKRSRLLKDFSKFQVELAANVVGQIRQFQEQGILGLGEEAAKAQQKLDDSVTNALKGAGQATVDFISGVQDTLDDTLKEIAQKDAKLTKDLQVQLAQRKINQQQFNQDLLELQRGKVADDIGAEKEALAKLTAARSGNSEEAIAIRGQISENVKKLSALDRDIEIAQLQRLSEIRSALRDRDSSERKIKLGKDIRDLAAAGASEIEIEQRISRNKSSNIDSAIEAKRDEIRLAQETGASEAERIKLNTELNELNEERKLGVRELADLENRIANDQERQVGAISDAALAAAKLNEIVNQIAESVEFIGDPDNLDQLNDKLQELTASLKQTQEEIFKEGKLSSVTLAAQVAILEGAIAGLEARIKEVTLRQAREAAEEAARIRLEKATETAEGLKDIEIDLQAELLDLQKQARKVRRDAKEDEGASDEKFADDKTDLEEDLQSDLTDIDREEAEKRAQFDAQDKAEQLQREQDLAKEITDIRRQSAKDSLKASTDAFVEIAGIQNQIAALEKLLAGGGLSTEEEERILGQRVDLDKKLADAQAKEAARAKREAEKQAKLDAAIKEGGSADALKIKTDAIEEEADLEEQREQAIKDLGENATKEQIAELNRRFDQRLAIIRQGAIDDLAVLAAQEAARAKQRAEERQAEFDALDDKRKDRQDAFNQALEDLNERHDKELDAIQDRLDKEIDKIKKNRVKAEAEAEAQTAKLLEQFGLTAEGAKEFLDSIDGDFQDIDKTVKGLISTIQTLGNAIQNIPEPPASTGAPSGTTKSGTGGTGTGKTGGSSGGGKIFGGGGTSNRVVSGRPTTVPAPPSSPITAQPGGDIEDFAGFNEADLRERLRNLYERFRSGKIDFKRVLEVIGLLRDKRKVNAFDATRLAALFKVAKNKQQFNEGLEQIFNPGRTASDFGGSQADFGEPSLGSSALAPTDQGAVPVLPPKPGNEPFIIPPGPNLPAPVFPTNGGSAGGATVINNITNNFTGFFGSDAEREIERIFKRQLQDVFNRKKIF